MSEQILKAIEVWRMLRDITSGDIMAEWIESEIKRRHDEAEERAKPIEHEWLLSIGYELHGETSSDGRRRNTYHKAGWPTIEYHVEMSRLECGTTPFYVKNRGEFEDVLRVVFGINLKAVKYAGNLQLRGGIETRQLSNTMAIYPGTQVTFRDDGIIHLSPITAQGLKHARQLVESGDWWITYIGGGE